MSESKKKEERKKSFREILTAFERLKLPVILHRKDDYFMLKKLRLVKEQLAWNEQEYKVAVLEEGDAFTDDRGVKRIVPKDSVMYRYGMIPDKEIVFGEVIHGRIVKKLKALHEAKDLDDDYFTLYEKFVLKPEKE